MKKLRKSGGDDILVIVGGIIPEDDHDALKKAGVAAVFTPGSALTQIVSFIKENVKS